MSISYTVCGKKDDKMENLKKIGDSAKMIRESRGLTIENSATKKLTKSSIGRLEQGVDIKTSTLLAWIEKFEISFEELLFVANNYQLTGYQALLKKVEQTYGENREVALKKQLHDAKWYYENVGKTKRDKLNYLMLKNIISIYDAEYALDTREKNQISNHLMSILDWSNYELALCGNTINAFSGEQFIQLAKSVVSRSKRYQDVLRNPKVIHNVLINVASSLVDNEDYTQATYFRNEARKLLKPQDVYERIVLNFLDGVVEFYTNNHEVGKRKMEQALVALESSETFGFLEMYQKRFDEIVKNSKSS